MSTVTGTAYIWAYLFQGDMEHEITTSATHWRTGAVCLGQHQLEFPIPEGNEAKAAAVESLRAARQELVDDTTARLNAIDNMISHLLCLEAPK